MSRTLLSLAVAGVLAITAGALPAAATTPPPSGSSASSPTLATPPKVGVPQPIASGDGWRVYGEGSRITGSASPTLVNNCGNVTCSVYLSRTQTRQINYDILDYGGGIGALAIACGAISVGTGPAGAYIAIACGAGITVYGAFLLNAVTHAAADNGCLRVRYTPGTNIFSFYDDHSAYCWTN